MKRKKVKVEKMTNDPVEMLDLIKKLKSTAKDLYRDSVIYHIADLLSEAADRLEDCYKAFVFIYSEKEVPEDVRRKLL